MKKRGIKLDEQTGDVAIKVRKNSLGLIDGGFVVGSVRRQNQATIVYIQPGEMKESPQIGVGISSMLLSSEALAYKHKIREQLEADGFTVAHLEIESNQRGEVNIELNADYQ